MTIAPARFCCVLLALVAPAVMAPPVAAADGPPERGGSIRHVLALLVDEAEQAKSQRVLTHDRPDFAARYEGGAIAPSEIERALRKPAHRDPFIDAYVRWQLTSLAPAAAPAPAEEMSDREFERLLEDAPALLPNPMAERAVIAEYRGLNGAGPLAAEARERVERVTAELEERRAAAERFNRPALELRAWFAERCPAKSPRRIRCLLETAVATIQAGWPPSEIKARVATALRDAAEDPAFGADARREVVTALRRLPGRECTYLKSVSFSDGVPEAVIMTAGFQEIDVQRWIEALGNSRTYAETEHCTRAKVRWAPKPR